MPHKIYHYVYISIYYFLIYTHIYGCIYEHIINNTFSYCCSGRRNETIDTRKKKKCKARGTGEKQGAQLSPRGYFYSSTRSRKADTFYTLAHTNFNPKKKKKKSLVCITFIFIFFFVPSILALYSQSSNRNIGVT